MQALTGPTALALERGRATFNAKFAAARAASTGIDAEAFLGHLAAVVDPVVAAVAALYLYFW